MRFDECDDGDEVFDRLRDDQLTEAIDLNLTKCTKPDHWHTGDCKDCKEAENVNDNNC